VFLVRLIFLFFLGGWFFLTQNIYSIKTMSIQRLSWPISSTDSDLAPCVSLDFKTLLFHSNRPGGQGSFDIYISKWKNGRWGVPQNLEIINSKFYEGYPRLSPDGKMLFFSTNRHTKDFRNKNLDIWVSIKNNFGKWSRPHSVKRINSDWPEMSVSLAVDQKTMYFSSARKGGRGGFDIYESKKDFYNQWSKPVLMPYINSTSDEMNPKLLLAENKFLFTSNKENEDKYQLYESSRININEEFQRITKSSNWINKYNVKNFSLSENGTSIFISKGKEKEENLYEVRMLGYFIPNSVIRISGIVTDKELERPIKAVKLNFIINYPKVLLGTQFLPEKYTSTLTIGETGKYSIFLLKKQKYLLKINHVGYKPYRKIFNFKKNKVAYNQTLNISLESRPLKQENEKIFFSYQSIQLSTEMLNILDRYIDYFKTDFKKKVYLFGYSSVIEHQIKKNKNLGYLRALKIKEYFMSKDVNSSRIRIVGQAVKGSKDLFYTRKERAKFRFVLVKTKE